MRTACFGSGARKTFTTKRLAADNCANLVAIDVDIASLNLLDNGLHPVVDARVQAKGQSIAARVDIVDDAVNVTLGLPIVRTSVDHGTALDLAWQGTANHHSMLAAIDLAVDLCRTGSHG